MGKNYFLPALWNAISGNPSAGQGTQWRQIWPLCASSRGQAAAEPQDRRYGCLRGHAQTCADSSQLRPKREGPNVQGRRQQQQERLCMAAHPHNTHLMPFSVSSDTRRPSPLRAPPAHSVLLREGKGPRWESLVLSGGQQPAVACLWAMTTKIALLVLPASSHGRRL